MAMGAGRIDSVLSSGGGMWGVEREKRGQRNLQDDVPRGPVFNHTTDYATAVRRPAEEQAGDLSREPSSPLRARATCPAFCSPPPLLCITTAKPPPPPHPLTPQYTAASRGIMSGICLQTRDSIKVKRVMMWQRAVGEQMEQSK